MNIEKLSEYDLEKMNNKLRSKFGYGPDGLRPNWKVSWANDLTEKRLMTHDDKGRELLFPEVRLVRKYQHIHDRYVLERQVPVTGETDLVVPVSNEPAWTFEDRFGNYLPPRFDACEFVIERIYANVADGQLRNGTYFKKKYFDPNSTEEQRLANIDAMEKHLFGNETPVGDALTHKYGVTDFHEKVTFDSAEPKKEEGVL